MAGQEQGLVVSHYILLEKEVRGTKDEADMRTLEVGLDNVAVVAVLDNTDSQLVAGNSAGNKARQQLSKQRVLENYSQVSIGQSVRA
jgi:hypothetical protein